MTVAAVDYFSIFQKRRTADGVVFNAVDPATIPWSLLSTSQALPYGDFGITLGAVAATPLTISITYNLAEVRQAIMTFQTISNMGRLTST